MTQYTRSFCYCTLSSAVGFDFLMIREREPSNELYQMSPCSQPFYIRCLNSVLFFSILLLPFITIRFNFPF